MFYTISGIEVFSFDFQTDKIIYHSGDLMNLSLTISSKKLQIANVSIIGIKNKMNIKKQVELKKGKTFLNFEYALPQCNVCGGIRPGNYTIFAEVASKEFTKNITKTIKILQ